MNVRIIAITTPADDLQEDHGIWTAEDLIAYCARVSNPSNQLNTETAPRLLAYCIRHGHWSVFETASMTVEVETSRAIAAQLLRDELEQQAICNGAGASRELSLRTTIDALQKELCVLRERIVREGYIVTNFDGTIELAIDPWHKREKEVKP